MKVLNLLLEITIYSWVLFGGIMLIKKLAGKGSSPTLQYLVWVLFIARLCIPITLESSIRLFEIPRLGTPIEHGMGITQWDSTMDHKFDHKSSNNPEAIPTGMEPALKLPKGDQLLQGNEPASLRRFDAKVEDSYPNPTMKMDWYQLAIGIWLMGVIGVLSFFVMISINMNKKIKRTGITPPEELVAMVENCRKRLHIKKPIAIYLIEDMTTPALTVSWNPKLLFPAHMLETMEDGQVLFAVEHELTHLKRKDHLVSLLLRILEAVYWFNPIVWIASKKIIMDIESACDSRVVKTMGKTEKNYYAMTILGMFAREEKAQFILGMAMMGTKKVAEKRIRGIYMKDRTKPRVRLLVTILSATLIFSCFTTACQPTPENPVVIGKGGSELDKAIKSKPDTEGDENKQANITSYIDSFPGADEKIVFNIDADVVMPGGNMPVVEVKPHYIDMEQIKAMAKALFHGNTAYEPKVDLTKIDLEKEILELQQIISDNDAMLEYYSGDQQTVDDVKTMYKQRIAGYQKQHEDAPETTEQRETDWIFRPQAYYTDMVLFGGGLEDDNDESRELKQRYYDSEMMVLDSKVLDYDARLAVSNLEINSVIEHYATFSTGSIVDGFDTPYWEEIDSQPMTMTREEAISMVQDTLEEMGIDNMEISHCKAASKPQPIVMLQDPGLTEEQANILAASGEGRDMDERDAEEKGEDVYGYLMSFTPTYEGVVTHDMSAVDYMYDSQYGSSYPYEELSVDVQNGVITSLRWSSPMEQVKVENENVSILSLEEAINTFKQQMQLEFTLHKSIYNQPEEGVDFEEYRSRIELVEINITEIRLGLIRMRVKDRPGAYRMIPAWIFSGYEAIEHNSESYTFDALPYGVINAIDGSIMDTSQGY